MSDMILFQLVLLLETWPLQCKLDHYHHGIEPDKQHCSVSTTALY